jgi:serine protease Do
MSENLILELIDRYLNGDMTAAERAEFETLRKNDANVDSKVIEHKLFVGLIKQYGERVELEKRLDAIHSEIDVHTLKEELMIHPNWIVSMWRHHHSKISVAASIAIFAILGTLFFTGKLSNHNSNYEQLKGQIKRVEDKANDLQNQTNTIIKETHVKPRNTNPGKYRGTGFALSSNGYIATDFHVVDGADSIYVQNSAGESFHAKVIYSEPQYDIAILQINDPAFKDLGNVPYNFKKSLSDLGEDVYTFGYPSGVENFGPGSLTARSGHSGDSTEYQVSIPVNPGNSGGPLLDSKGNVIGIISGRQPDVAGAGFAKKSAFLLNAIQNIPSDSLSKDLTLSTKNTLAGLSRPQQVKKLKNYVFMVKAY